MPPHPELYDQANDDDLDAHGKTWYGQVCQSCGEINRVGEFDHGTEMLGVLWVIVPALVIAFLAGAVTRPIIDEALLPVLRVVLGS